MTALTCRANTMPVASTVACSYAWAGQVIYTKSPLIVFHSVIAVAISRIKVLQDAIPNKILGLPVEKNCVMNRPPPLCAVVA